jgi:hypothetical protein
MISLHRLRFVLWLPEEKTCRTRADLTRQTITPAFVKLDKNPTQLVIVRQIESTAAFRISLVK